MKRIALIFCIVLSLILFIRIVRILWYDFSRLTDYGFGYLAGSVILFLLFASFSYLLARKPAQRDN